MNEFLAEIGYLKTNKSAALTYTYVGTGSRSFTTETGKDFVVGEPIELRQEGWYFGYAQATLTAYNSATGAMTVNIASVGTIYGAITSWTIRQYDYIRASTAGYVTAPGDTPSSTHWPGRLINPGTVSRHLFGKGNTRGSTEVATATITLNNSDGAYDDLIAYSFDGAPVTLMMGDKGAAFSTFTQTTAPLGKYFVGVAEQPVYNDNGDGSTLTISARDALHALDIPLQARKFAGTATSTTGIEGTAGDLLGKPKPVCLGYVYNVTPPLCNATLGVYMLSGYGLDSAATVTVYDNHVSTGITRGADYSNLAALEATAPAAGEYRVWPSGGVFRLGFTPVGQITADVVNNGFASFTGLAFLLPAMLFEAGRYVVPYGLAPGPLNTSNNIYETEETNLLDAVDGMLAGINGCLFASKAGTITLGQLVEPSGTPSVYITEGQVLQIARTVPDPSTTRGIPAWRINLKYKRNHTIQTEQQLTGSATPDDIAFCANEYRTVTWEDATVQKQWPLSPELNVTTWLNEQAQAQNEADRLGTIHGVRRDMLSVTVPLNDDTSPLEVNQIVSLTHSRYGLSGGKLFQVLGYELQAPSAQQTGTITLTLFG